MLGPFTEYVRPYVKRILIGLLAIAVAQSAANSVPLFIRAAIDSLEFQAGGIADLTPAIRDGILRTIELYSLQIVALSLVVALGNYAMRRLLGVTSTRIEYDIRVAYFAHLLRLPLSYYQTHRTGDLMARATNDLNAVRIFFTYGVRGMVETALILLISIAMMLYIDWQLALVVLIPMPLFSLSIIRMASLVHSRFKAIQEFFGQISNFIQENLSGIRVVKAYVQSPAQNEAFDELNQAYLEKNNHLVRTRAIYRPLSFLVASVGLGLNLWIGGRAVVDGGMTMGDFVAFNAYLTLFIRPIMYMGWVIDRFQRALVSMRRINEVMGVEPEIQDRSPAHRLTDGRETVAAAIADSDKSDRPDDVIKTGELDPPIIIARDETDPSAGIVGHETPAPKGVTGHIQFHDLTFAYGDVPVLQNIDLEIPAGTTLGIIGRVGSGKTTLARLIPRLIQAGPGQLRIDRVPAEEWPLEELRADIGYVSQNPFLFSNTISANVAYGVENAGAEQIVLASEQAQLRQDVEEFERGFDTLIGERGVTLSGGQKQRATLARALIRQPSILILDDALSAVDTHTEEAILGHLRQIMKDRTTLLIAHRISTLRDADQIVVLDEGRIAERGTHRQLVELGGFYADLSRRQQLAAELETL